MGQSESSEKNEHLLPDRSNEFRRSKKMSKNGKVSLKSELDNVSAGSGESNDEIVSAIEDALASDSSHFSNRSTNETTAATTGTRLTVEVEQKLREDLQKAEDDIAMYKQSLQSRIQYASELRKRLGLTVWNEISEDVSKGVRTIKESQAYQRTGEVVHQAGDTISKTLDNWRKSPAVKNLGDKVGTVYSSVKSKLPKPPVNFQFSDKSKQEKEPILLNE